MHKDHSIRKIPVTHFFPEGQMTFYLNREGFISHLFSRKEKAENKGFIH